MAVTETVRDIGALTKKAQVACKLFMEECKKRGLNVLITETYRSQERQNYLYEQGRTRPGKVVTWTKKSRHTSRRAWDICKNQKGAEYSDESFFKECGAVAAKFGIVWGGTWKTPDTPHFEVSENWNYEGDDEMTEVERQKFNALVEVVESLTLKIDELQKNNKVYHYYNELPDYAYETIMKLATKGIYKGASESDLNLPETLMRVLVINDRAGLYD